MASERADPNAGLASNVQHVADRFERWAIVISIRFGLLGALAAIALGCVAKDRVRVIAAGVVVIVAWLLGYALYRRDPVARRDRTRAAGRPTRLDRLPFLLAAACVVPFAIDGRAQTTIFVAVAPVAGIAGVRLRGRRQAIAFGAIWVAAYVGGVTIASGWRELTGSSSAFDAILQITAMALLTVVFAEGIRIFYDVVFGADAYLEDVRAGGRAERPDLGEEIAAQARATLDGQGRRPNDPQLQVIRRLARDFNREEIAGQLHLQEESVKSRIDAARRRTGAKNTIHLVARYALGEFDEL